jgi:hypothetical protein
MSILERIPSIPLRFTLSGDWPSNLVPPTETPGLIEQAYDELGRLFVAGNPMFDVFTENARTEIGRILTKEQATVINGSIMISMPYNYQGRVVGMGLHEEVGSALQSMILDSWACKTDIYQTIIHPRYELLQTPIIFFFGHTVSKCPGEVVVVFNTIFEKKLKTGGGGKEGGDHAIQNVN